MAGGGKILRGLREANHHAICFNQHRQHHITTKTGEHEFTVECSECGSKWTEEDRGDWHKHIHIVRGKK